MEVLANTKVYNNYQTDIPKEMREKFNIDKETIIEWGVNDDGTPGINFRKKITVDGVLGMIDDDGSQSSVELKRSIYE